MATELPEPNVVVIARSGRNILAFVLRDVPEGEAIDRALAACADQTIEYKTCYRCNSFRALGEEG